MQTQRQETLPVSKMWQGIQVGAAKETAFGGKKLYIGQCVNQKP